MSGTSAASATLTMLDFQSCTPNIYLHKYLTSDTKLKKKINLIVIAQAVDNVTQLTRAVPTVMLQSFVSLWWSVVCMTVTSV